MKLAFYKAWRKDASWLDWAIAAWLPAGAGKYSHVEIVFKHGLCFSSTTRTGEEGTRFKEITFDEGKWDFIDVPCTPLEELRVLAWCQTQTGKPYDFAGIFSILTPLPFWRHKSESWFCSEVCVAALQSIGKFAGKRPESISPNTLAKLARKGQW